MKDRRFEHRVKASPEGVLAQQNATKLPQRLSIDREIGAFEDWPQRVEDLSGNTTTDGDVCPQAISREEDECKGMLHQLTFQIDKQTSEGIYVINIYVINKCELRPGIKKGKC